MTLRRTASGLASLTIFFNVDVVVFCEGGSEITIAQIGAGDGDQETLDVCFWQNVLRLDNCQKKVHVKSIGCKTVLQTISRDVRAHGIGGIKTCFDRDYDFYLGRELVHDSVFYTFGYSWENDVLVPQVLEGVFWQFRNRTEAAENIWTQMKNDLEAFAQEVAKYTEMDLAFVSRGKSGLFPRDKPVSALDLSGGTPSLNRAVLASVLTSSGYKRGPRATVKVTHSAALRATYGHLVASYVYHLFRVSAQQSTKGKGRGRFPDFSSFMRLAIGQFSSLLHGNSLEDMGEYLLEVRQTLLA